MGSDGWLGIGWPEEWGGQGRSAIEQFIFFDESMRSGAPVPMLTINTVGPTIMNFGTQEQKQFFLPKILAGEIHFCIGYTEPNSGTDLASLTTRAVRDGDEYVINGSKIFTSLAGDADYIWLATRTDPNVAKHKGISMFVVPMDTPGIRVVPMKLLGDHNINYTFYEDVRVPATSLVGGENQGWNLITNQLNHERVTLCSPGIIERVLTDVRAWAQDDQAARRPARRRPGVGAGAPRPGARRARVPPPHQLEGGVAGHAGPPRRGRRLERSRSSAPSSTCGPSARCWRSWGRPATCTRGSPGAVVAGRLEMYARSMIILTFGGGTNEIQRDLIAIFGLGMPRSLR